MMKKFWKSGDPFVWLTGGAVAICLLMIAALALLILKNGLGQFWPKKLVELQLTDGSKILGEVWNREVVPNPDESAKKLYRLRLKIGNRDLYSLDFKWVDEAQIAVRTYPEAALALERLEWGNFYGYFKELRDKDEVVASGLTGGMEKLSAALGRMQDLRVRVERIEKEEIGEINYELERLRLAVRKIALRSDTTAVSVQEKLAGMRQEMQSLQARYLAKEEKLRALYDASRQSVLTVASADGREREIRVYEIVRVTQPNAMGIFDKSATYMGKMWEFVSGDPRESNTEGGVFPAIFGTVILVIIMSIAVVPLGVLAAIYLREYAKQGFWVRAIRIAVNNLAGVPSIVYGIFGLGFFIYAIGGTIDQLFFPEALPTPTFGRGGILWASLTLALLTVPVVIVATEEGLAAVPRELREGSLALAATKFETLWRVVIPSAMPGILTGLILAIARAAGEVAPLMITGVVKLAPALPLDGQALFLHLERKFMHLGFHIYDVGFQSPNVEAAIPMVYSTTLLLLLIVVLLNIIAIYVRNRLRRKLACSVF